MTEPTPAIVVDLSDALLETGDGVHWTLERHGDLNVNLVRLEPGHSVDEHVNHAVDVVLVVSAGAGHIWVDGVSTPLRAHVVADVPRGTARRIAAGPEGLSYLTVHRRRTLDIRAKLDRDGERGT